MARITSIGQLPPVHLARREVSVPELGGEFLVWELTARERTDWETGGLTQKGGRITKLDLGSSTERLLQKALKDDDGRPQFSAADIKALMRQPASGIAKLERVARELSGLAIDSDDEDDSDTTGDSDGEAVAAGNGSAPATFSLTT
jgi:hypothetical protein